MNNQMTQGDAERLSIVLSSTQFKTSKCDNATRIKLVRIQIAIDPIAEQVKKARETVDKQFMSERLKELISLSQEKKILEGTPEASELYKLYEDYKKNADEAMSAVLDKQVDIVIDKLNVKEYGDVMDSNGDWISGDTPKLIFVNLVDETTPVESK